MADFFRSVIEDTLSDMSMNSNSFEAKIKLLELENEKLKYSHSKEIADLKTNTDLILCEMKKSLENEKTRITNEIRKQCELERIRAIEETKKKQWCSKCGKEAQLYCCWNTSYCDYSCQQVHWPKHLTYCTRQSIQECDKNITNSNVSKKKNRKQKKVIILLKKFLSIYISCYSKKVV